MQLLMVVIFHKLQQNQKEWYRCSWISSQIVMVYKVQIARVVRIHKRSTYSVIRNAQITNVCSVRKPRILLEVVFFQNEL